MGLINTKQLVTRDQVYEEIDDMVIFNYYLGSFQFRKAYPSVFRKDDNPSCGIFINKAGKLIYNDITTKEKLDAFAFVAKKFDIGYGEAIKKVACDFGIIPCDTPPVVKARDFNLARKYEEELKKDTDIQIEYGKWDHNAMRYWRQYTITEEELVKSDVYNIDRLKINGTYINNYTGALRFGYALPIKEKIHYKIYQPEGNPQYKWITNIPLHVPFNYKNLAYKSKELIITKSVKELILFKRYFPEVIALQNESQSALREVTLKFLKSKYENIYLFFDGDKTGINNAKEYEQRGLTPIYLPEKVIAPGMKDCADLVSNYGIKQFERFLKINELL